MQGAEVDLDHTVLTQVHHLDHGGLQFRPLGDGEVAEEHRVLQPLTMVLHEGADAPQPFRIGDVVGHQVPAAGHGVTVTG